jgi:FixJ family two-component response regulator
MDVQMPGMSGIETYHRLQESNSELHVVFITGTGSEELINRMKTETVLDVIYKPLDISKILNLVDAIGPRGKVLVADADPDYALEVSHLLVAHDFDSDTATNARMVLEKLRCEDVNLLVLDLSLPGFTDPEICVALTEDIERQHPTVLISGYPAEGEEIGQKAIENLIRLSSAKRITGHPAPIALVALIEEYDGKTRGDPKHGL